MEPLPITVTFASLLSPPGVVAAAAIVTGLVSLIKTTFPGGFTTSGALMAFVLTAILYVLTGIAVGVATLDQGLLVFLAWLSAATSAVGIHGSITHVQEANR